VILGLSSRKELIELSLEELDESLSINNNIVLHTEMFQRTDIIMEKICAKVKELHALYESLSAEQDKLKRINMYAAKQKLQIKPRGPPEESAPQEEDKARLLLGTRHLPGDARKKSVFKFK